MYEDECCDQRWQITLCTVVITPPTALTLLWLCTESYLCMCMFQGWSFTWLFSTEAVCLSHMGLISIPRSLSLSPCLKNSSMILSVHCRYTARGFVGLLRSAQCTMFLNTCTNTQSQVIHYAKIRTLNSDECVTVQLIFFRQNPEWREAVRNVRERHSLVSATDVSDCLPSLWIGTDNG